jgi:hypothetical protein
MYIHHQETSLNPGSWVTTYCPDRRTARAVMLRLTANNLPFMVAPDHLTPWNYSYN